jgi:hypothetical protein
MSSPQYYNSSDNFYCLNGYISNNLDAKSFTCGNITLTGNLDSGNVNTGNLYADKIYYNELIPEIVPAQTYAMDGPPSKIFGNAPDWYIDKKSQKNYKKLLIPVEVINFPNFTGTEFDASDELTFNSALSSAQSGDIINITNNISFTTTKTINDRNILIRSKPSFNNKFTITSTSSTTVFSSQASICISKLNIIHNVVSTGAQAIISVTPSPTLANNGWLPYCFDDVNFTISEFGFYGSPVQDVQFTNCNFLYNGLTINNNHSYLIFTGMKNVCVDNCTFTNSNDLISGRSRWITITPGILSSGFNNLRGSLRVSNTIDITNNANGRGRQVIIYEGVQLGTGISNTSLYVFNNEFKEFTGGFIIIYGSNFLNNFKDIIAYNNKYSNLSQPKGFIALDNIITGSSTGVLQGEFYSDNTNVAGDISFYFAGYESLISLDTTLNQVDFQITYNASQFSTVTAVTVEPLSNGSDWIYEYLPLGREIIQSGSGSGVAIPLVISNLNNTNYNWFELTMYYSPSVNTVINWDFSSNNGVSYGVGSVTSSTLRNQDNWQLWQRGGVSPLPLNGTLPGNFGITITFKWTRPLYNVADVVSLDFETKQQSSGVGAQLTKGIVQDTPFPTNFRFTNASGTGTCSYQYQVIGYNLPQ